MNSFKHQYMVVHLDDDFFPQLEKAIKPYQHLQSQNKTNNHNVNNNTMVNNNQRTIAYSYIS